jgi:thioredoxin 1
MLIMQEWNYEQLKDNLLKNKRCAFYLYTPFCGTCQVAGKMLEVVSELIPHLPIGKANLNIIPRLANDYKIESVPCLLLFEHGKIVEKIYAFHSVPYLLERLKK